MINVYIMSGVPGSGKSYHATRFAEVMDQEGEEGIIISADHYFSPGLNAAIGEEIYFGIPFNVVDDGLIKAALKDYQFGIVDLAKAHQKCMRAFVTMLTGAYEEGQDFNIIVDNTNIHSHEIAPYYLVGEAFGAEVEILRISAPVELCVTQNVHCVPSQVILDMSLAFHATKPHPWQEGEMPAQHMPWWSSRDV